MKQPLPAALLFFCLIPAAAQASAVKECRVEAVVTAVKESGKTPRLLVNVKSATFERGHSMGEDCSELTRFPEQEVTLNEPFATKVGATIILTYIDVRNFSEGKRMMHTSWQIHADEVRKTKSK